MALKKILAKEHNQLHFDFPNAYWRIENIHFGSESGELYVSFDFHCYPNETAARNDSEPTKLSFGDYRHIHGDLYIWHAIIKWSNITSDPIPTTETAQKDILYPYIKGYLSYLSDAEDVLES